MSEKVKTYKPIKNLSRDPNGSLSYEPFTANGHKYCFIRPGDPLGIKKWTMYSKLKNVFSTGQTFASIVEGHNQMADILGADKPFAQIRTEAILLNDSYKKAILDMSKDKYDKAFYLCSIFIYREGDDPYEWDINTAERDIAEWLSDRINEQDLFFFAMLLTPGYNKVLNELRSEAERKAEQMARLSGGIG